MAYTHFRYIAYEIPTVCKDNSKKFIELPADGAIDLGLYKRTGFPPEIKSISNVDARNRVARLWSAMLDAQDHISKNLPDDQYTLNVFLVPEFYFRPVPSKSTTKPQTNSYTYKEYQEIKTSLRALISKKNEFKHWLIISGTILWSGPGTIGKRPPLTKDQRVFFNTALVLNIDSSKGSRIVEKAQHSDIDGLPTESLTGTLGYMATDEAYNYYQTDSKIQAHFFAHGGVPMGLEICLEHGLGTLKNAILDQTSSFQKYRKAPTLHLLISGGKSYEIKHIAAKPKGYFLRNDGYKLTAEQSQLLKVIQYFDNSGIPVTVRHNPSLAGIQKVGYHESIPLEHLMGSLEMPSNADPSYWFDENIRIYPRMGLM